MMKDMDLKNYNEMPDSGLYEKIERRVQRRRAMRRGGVAFAAALVVGVGVWFLSTKNTTVSNVATLQGAEVADLQAPQHGTEMTVATDATAADNTTMQASAATTATPLQPCSEFEHGRSVAGDKSALPAAMAEGTSYVAQREQPVLPSSQVNPVATTIDDLILEPATVADVTPSTPSPQPKAGAVPEPVTVENLLWAPNAIILSDDVDAENRVFKLVTNSTVNDFHLLIFNRAGRQVFSSNDINHAWDGRRNGSWVPQGAYMWVARFRDSEGRLHTEKGTVTVIR